MAVSIDVPSTRITVNASKVRPALFVDGKRAVCHLTQGFMDLEHMNDAFTAMGTVKVSGLDAEVGRYDIKFIQFQKMRSYSLRFGGEGVAAERILLTPNYTPNPALDSGAAFTLFTGGANAILRSSVATNTTGDHPASRISSSLIHRVSGRRLFLSSITDSREFWTAFVARAPDGTITYLSHFHWELLYSFSLEWQPAAFGDGCDLTRSTSASLVTFDPPVPGPPRAPELQGMLDRPAPPFANDVTNAAMTAAVLGGVPLRWDLSF